MRFRFACALLAIITLMGFDSRSGLAQTTGTSETKATGAEVKLPTQNAAPDTGGGSILFIGNATVLIRYAGFTILTDPTFVHMHEKVPLGYGLEATRLTNPAMDIKDLPPLDLIVLSHFHGDHFDQAAERDLDKSLPIVTVREAAEELGKRGFGNTHALSTWSSQTFAKGNVRLRITSLPGRHGPPGAHLVLPDVMGSLLEFLSPSGVVLFSMYITGDTLVTDDLKQIPQRYPDIDLALLHLGGTQVLGIMVTMDGKQGVEVMQTINPKRAIPIHYDDYDVFKSPLSDFQHKVKAAGLEERVTYLDRGGSYTFKIAPDRANR